MTSDRLIEIGNENTITVDFIRCFSKGQKVVLELLQLLER